MQKKRTLVLVAIALMASSLHAGFFRDGNDLLDRLQTDQRQASGFYGYVSAIVDSLDGRGLPEIGCFKIPSGVELGQIADTFRIYLEKNPGVRHRNAAHLAVMALSIDYPCR